MPRVFREQAAELCEDAAAFREEAHRRVTATIEAQGDPGSGNRVRLIGYDTLLEEEHYQGFPLEFFSVPGHLVTSLNGENLEGTFRAFIHAPFKQDEMVGDRHNTSLVCRCFSAPIPALMGSCCLETTSTNRSEEHTSELQSLMRISYAAFG